MKGKILVTGANGFIGTHVVQSLLNLNPCEVTCFVRPSGYTTRLEKITQKAPNGTVTLIKGNLLSRDDCRRAVKNVETIIHLAAGIEKSFPGSYLNTVVTTRNLIEEALSEGRVKRFLNVSSLAVYSNWSMKRGELIDEKSKIEDSVLDRHDPYVYAKVNQELIVRHYGEKAKLPYVIVRPGAVYGPEKKTITGRVGIDTFGFFMHLGGSNRIPLTYVDNCADAIVLAALKQGIEGESFNIVDDNLPTSRQWLEIHKKMWPHFRSLSIPYPVFYFFSFVWEKYSGWSHNQLPPVFNRRRCATYWKGNTYSNQKLKTLLGWMPRICCEEAIRNYFELAEEKSE
jgi:nucleoside-diphosphate-sugar epimerase